jgi:hypothetical protein
MNDRWTPKSGSLFREREPGKEIQPPLVVPRIFECEFRLFPVLGAELLL